MLNALKIFFKTIKALKTCTTGYVLIRKNQDGTFEMEELAVAKFNRTLKK
jgi:hypothetical protein